MDTGKKAPVPESFSVDALVTSQRVGEMTMGMNGKEAPDQKQRERKALQLYYADLSGMASTRWVASNPNLWKDFSEQRDHKWTQFIKEEMGPLYRPGRGKRLPSRV